MRDVGCRRALPGTGCEHVPFRRCVHAGARAATVATLVCDIHVTFLQGSRESQEAMVKLLQPGVPDVVVSATCRHDSLVCVMQDVTGVQVGNACVVIMQLANDAAHVACLQTFGRLGAIGASRVARRVCCGCGVTPPPCSCSSRCHQARAGCSPEECRHRRCALFEPAAVQFVTCNVCPNNCDTRRSDWRRLLFPQSPVLRRSRPTASSCRHACCALSDDASVTRARRRCTASRSSAATCTNSLRVRLGVRVSSERVARVQQRRCGALRTTLSV